MLKINAELIRKLLHERGLSINRFALQAGLSRVTATKVTKDGSRATAPTVARIARFFGVEGDKLILAEK